MISLLDQNSQTKNGGMGNKEQHGHFPHAYSQESCLYLKREYCNLYCTVTGDWLTFTSPVERRKRETEGGAQSLTGQPGRMNVYEVEGEQSQQDGSVSWGCRLILTAGYLHTNQTRDWCSEALSGSTDIKLPGQCCAISLNVSNTNN